MGVPPMWSRVCWRRCGNTLATSRSRMTSLWWPCAARARSRIRKNSGAGCRNSHEFGYRKTASERQPQCRDVVPGNRLEFGFFGRLEGFAALPGVVSGRDDPEVAVGVSNDPVVRAGPIDVEGYLAF